MINLFFLLSALMFGFSQNIQAETPAELFLIITTDVAETQMMALILATQSMNQDVNVRILLCGEAANLTLKSSESPAFKPVNRSPKDLLRGLLSKGAVVEVCGIFFPNRPNLSADDLIENIGTAQPPEIAAYMKRPEIRYFSF